MPNAFNITRLLIGALILLATSFSLTSCGKTKGTSSEELYGEIKASQGASYTVLVQEYIGISPLYCGCDQRYQTVGHEELTTQGVVTTCPTEVKTYCYSAIIPVEKAGQSYFLPITIRSYEPIQLSNYPVETIGNIDFSKVEVTARLDVSSVSTYRGTGEYIFLVSGTETDDEIKTSQGRLGQTPGNDRP